VRNLPPPMTPTDQATRRARAHRSDQRWTRRHVLKTAGAMLPLPFLESLHHRLYGATVAEAAAVAPKRFLCVHFSYGVRPDKWWPESGVKHWERAPLLEPLAEHRDELTLLRGVSLVRGTTHGVHGQPYQFLNADRQSKVSMDQLLASHMDFGGASRYPSLETGGSTLPEGIAFTREGVPLPAVSDARQLYQLLFGDDQADPRVALRRLRERKSMLDGLIGDIRDVERKLDRLDREKLDEYLSSVRQIERKIAKTEEWLHTPKPTPTISEPKATPALEDFRELADVFLELLLAAFETDQTRVASFFFDNSKIPTAGGGVANYHSFTHHNGDKQKLKDLAAADLIRNQAFSDLLKVLKERREADGSRMIDNTLVLYGSATEDASTHRGVSLPLVVAGRPELFKHGRHHGGMVEYGPRQKGMSDLLLTLLQAQGVEENSFAEAHSPMSELLV